MSKTIGAIGLAATVLLAACGGGGGDSGQAKYSIELSPHKNTLPLNIAGVQPGKGAYAQYTTEINVVVRNGNRLETGARVSCNSTNLGTGTLYYLNGEDEATEDGALVGNESIALTTAAGGTSFYYHARDQVGTSTITCSVHDPDRDRDVSASVVIRVGASAGKAANVRATTQAPFYLGSRGNTGDIPESVALQVEVRDDANQPIADPANANLQVSILPSAASDGARLMWGGQTGSVLQVGTHGGLGTLSLRSGLEAGPILLELVTDRFDNNVTNGIQDPITARTVVYAYDGIESATMEVEDAELTVGNGVPFATALKVSGGFPPYTWTLVGGKLPAGLSLSPSGLISGTPSGLAGDYPFTVRVTDGKARYLEVNHVLKLVGDPAVVAALNANCSSGGDSSNVCELPEATDGQSYYYVFSAMSADPDLPITWSFDGLPSHGLNGTADTGTISGTASNSSCGTATPVTQTAMFSVTATQGAVSSTRAAKIKVICP